MTDSKLTSIEIGRAALKIAVTGSRSEEQRIKQELAEQGIRSTAVDFGGEFIPSIVKIVERAVVAAQRQGLVSILVSLLSVIISSLFLYIFRYFNRSFINNCHY